MQSITLLIIPLFYLYKKREEREEEEKRDSFKRTSDRIEDNICPYVTFPLIRLIHHYTQINAFVVLVLDLEVKSPFVLYKVHVVKRDVFVRRNLERHKVET